MNTRARLLFVFLLCSVTGCATTSPVERAGDAIGADSMQAVVPRSFTAYGFVLESGQVLPEMTLAFETYGRLAPDGRNAILVTHGFTSSHHAAGRYAPTDTAARSPVSGTVSSVRARRSIPIGISSSRPTCSARHTAPPRPPPSSRAPPSRTVPTSRRSPSATS